MTVESPPLPALPELGFMPIARPELYVRLDNAVTSPVARVITISAPAGTGKTVLVADWLDRRLGRTHPNAEYYWVTIADPAAAHHDPRAALSACFGVGLPRAGRHDHTDDTEYTVAHIVSRLAARDRPVVVVIDNAHLISDPTAIDFLECFLAAAPPNTTMVLAGRHDLPLRWHLLDLDGRLTRVRAPDLAFTGLRAGQFTRRHGCALSEAELTTVLRLTRGWAALLRLAALHLGTQPDRAAALAELASVPPPLADFLAAEVVATLPESLLRFAIGLSVPVAFTRSLAVRLRAGEPPHSIDELVGLELPMTGTVRDGEVWYTLHPLLRAHLLNRLYRSDIEWSYTLHRHTADWYLAAGLPREALPHVVRASDTELLAWFLREHAFRLVLDGHGPMLFEHLEQAGSISLNDPFVWALRVLDALEHDDADKATTYLDVLALRPRESGRIVPAGWIDSLYLAAWAAITRVTGTGPSEFQLPEPIPESGHAPIDAYSAGEIGMALLADGEDTEGEGLLRRGAALAESSAIPRLHVRAATRLAITAAIRDEPGPMREQAGLAVDLAERHGLRDCADGIAARTVEAFAAYLRGGHTTVPTTASFPVIQRIPAPPDGPAAARITDILAELLAFDDSPDKRRAAERLRRSAVVLLRGPSSLPALTGRLLPHVVPILLEVRAVDSARLLTDEAGSRLGRTAEIVLAEALLELANRPRVARGLVAPLRVDIETVRPQTVVTAWLVEGVALAALRNRSAARDALEHALGDAAPDQLVRPFLDMPGAVALLDDHIGTLGPHDDFAQRIRRHPRLRRIAAQPRLTPMELTVLEQMPSGRTAAQMAANLGISVNTVKTHLRSLYAKFDAGSRAQAVESARRSGLL
ncbi:AAA family ATPase [Nocardia sp. ET3-3]|uniref:AAA family ATPase n=1 Tax=Nocardia terrae TaxID=2675851 RepID=A0A7K1V362_9NOCA|nr:LuxR C-terminal-related transcriptional regulator [Nocardia terrae]MVU80981.1 AAA family ATPase [Nocardia terrae]